MRNSQNTSPGQISFSRVIDLITVLMMFAVLCLIAGSAFALTLTIVDITVPKLAIPAIGFVVLVLLARLGKKAKGGAA